jgi:hypothetical protein
MKIVAFFDVMLRNVGVYHHSEKPAASICRVGADKMEAVCLSKTQVTTKTYGVTSKKTPHLSEHKYFHEIVFLEKTVVLHLGIGI